MLKTPRIIMVGAFPPPVHGMAAVNAAMRDVLNGVQAEPKIINLAAPNLDRSLVARLARLPRVLSGLVRLAVSRRMRNGMLYMSVSGGNGQIYDFLFIFIARWKLINIYLHHHSFAYIDGPNKVTKYLLRMAGARATHVVLSPRMGAKLKSIYRIRRTIPISNAVFFPPVDMARSQRLRINLGTLGFISNISAEKGVFEFLDLMEAVQNIGLSLRAKLAGPFQDMQTEESVRRRLTELPNVEYVGPKYGLQKDAFYDVIDTLVFPTCYMNEAEPLILHEAMARAIPIIAYGRGSIPEIVNVECGRIIDPGQSFIPEALAQINIWKTDPTVLEKASKAAVTRFTQTYTENHMRWQEFLSELTCR